MKEYKWVKIQADNVQQGQLLKFCGDENGGVYRRIFVDGYREYMDNHPSPCIICADDLSLRLCHKDNMVLIQEEIMSKNDMEELLKTNGMKCRDFGGNPCYMMQVAKWENIKDKIPQEQVREGRRFFEGQIPMINIYVS